MPDFFEKIILYMDEDNYDSALEEITWSSSNQIPADYKNLLKFLQIEIFLVTGRFQDIDVILPHIEPTSNFDKFVIHSLKGIKNTFTGDHNAAKSYFEKTKLSECKLQEHTNPLYNYWLSFTYNARGIYSVMTGDSTDAKTMFEQAYIYAKKSGSARKIAGSLDNLSIAHRNIGNYDEAIAYQNRVHELRKKTNGKHAVAITKGNLSELHEILGNLDDSMNYAIDALEIFLEVGKIEEISQSYHNLGRITYQQNKLDISIDYFSNALQHRKRTGVFSLISLDLYFLVITHLKYGDQEKAQSYLKELADLSTDDQPVIKLHYWLARIHFLRSIDPIIHLQEVLSLISKIEEHNKYDIRLSNIAKIQKIWVLFETITNGNYEENKKRIQKEILNLKKETYNRRNTLLDGELLVLQAKFEIINQNTNEALELLNQSESFSYEIKSNRLMKIIEETRIEISNSSEEPENHSINTTNLLNIDQILHQILNQFHRTH